MTIELASTRAVEKPWGRADLRPHFLIELCIMHLRHLFGRFQTASECLVHKIHGKVLSGLKKEKGRSRAHFGAIFKDTNQRN